ncbi:competence protein ComK [Aquibacillus sediminis]|uniref:competence protein ComK n=1 Tax=Aquibacillus sediminis TaxID=2574734 RepID=UPI001109BA8A|nr:competence protein ComK [Aquibacillus sediminis]
MKTIPNYHVNERTMALIPAYHIEYDTIVLEAGRQLFVQQPAIQIIKSACLDGYSTYEGRRKAVNYQMGVKRKVPIPICPMKNIFTFPTQAPTDYDCHWIFYHHVQSIEPYSSNEDSTIQSMITFKDGQHLPMKTSHHSLEKQMQRTAICILHFASFQQQRFTI